MSKSSALTENYKSEIVFAAGSLASIESIKAAANKAHILMVEATPDQTLTAEKCLSDSPFSSSTWDIVLAAGNVAGDIQFTFNSEDITNITTIGRPALASRRAIDFAVVATTNIFSAKSLVAALEFVQDLEDKVASTGVSATGDGTYTDVMLSGTTPYKKYQWTIVKLGAVYTVTPTAGS